MYRGTSLLALLGAFALALTAFGQIPSSTKNPLSARPSIRITNSVEDHERIVLLGNRHPLANPAYDLGFVSAEQPMRNMVLVLHPDSSQQKALEALLTQQRDPKSSLYHHWLTPEEYGKRFGVSDQDLEQVVNWLQRHGFSVEEVPSGRTSITFSGTASQVESAFHTQIHRFSIHGESHSANATDPEIPAALAGVVDGVASLHDFQSKPMHSMQMAHPEFTSGSGAHYLAPADFAAIYDVNALYNQGYDGSGQTIAIVGRSNIYLSDVRSFRSTFGLPVKDPLVIVPTTNPGTANSGDVGEAMLDVEWAGAVAKNATIAFVAAASTYTTDGTTLSAQYIVNNNLAPVMSMSYGLCERSLGAAQNSLFNSLWQQAAAQGISVFVSSGDSGAAGCDSSSATRASYGLGVNGLCSSPYSTCVGGTQFDDTVNPSLCWAPFNTSGTQSSALGYIPEKVWNESGSSGLWSSGGGVSTIYTKPSWQNVPGVPNDGMRDVPDVSLTAAGHDGYLVKLNGNLVVFGGTSAASPSFAGLMSLVVQNTGAPQGNANPRLYALASRQMLAGGAAVFHDIASGNNSVPGVTGYSAGTGYDAATGLGSVDAAQLVLHWSDSGSLPALTVTPSVTNLSILPSSSGSLTVTTTASGGFNSAISFSMSQLPAGVSASFTPASLAAPGSGTTTLKFTTSATPSPGTYSVKVNATSKGVTSSATITLTILPAPSFALSTGATALSIPAGSAGSTVVTAAPNSTFNAAISLKIAGMPAGMTAVFSSSSFSAPGSGSSTLAINTLSTVAAGTYGLTVSATGGGITKSTVVSVSVPGFTLAVSPASLSLNQGGSVTATVSTALLGGFNAPIALSASNLPSGVSATFGSTNIAAPGSGKVAVTFSASSGATLGTTVISITAAGGGVSRTTTLSLNVIPPPTFTISGPAAIAVFDGGSAQVLLSTAALYGFTAPIKVSVSGAPSGVTEQFSASTIAAGGSTALSTTASWAAVGGTSPLTITAVGGNITRTLQVPLTVTVPAVYSVSASVSSITLPIGGSTSLTFSTSGTSTFNAPVSLRVTGVPAGMTVGISPATIPAPGSGSSTITISNSTSVAAGSYTLTITTTGGSVTRSYSLIVNVPGFVAGVPSGISVARGHTVAIPINTQALAGFNASLVAQVSNLPANVTASFSPGTVVSPGSGRVVLLLSASTSSAVGSSPFTVTISGGGLTKTTSVTLIVQ